MDWIAEKFPLLIVAFVIGFRILQAIAKSRTAREQHQQESGETEEQRRVREIQERIRRAIASRRGGQMSRDLPPPVLHPAPTGTADNDPFHDENEPPLVVAPDPTVVARAARNAELERQEELAEKMRALAEAKALARHREQATAEATRVNTAATVRRHQLDDIIRDRENLRRAVLMREILGPPVGLR